VNNVRFDPLHSAGQHISPDDSSVPSAASVSEGLHEPMLVRPPGSDVMVTYSDACRDFWYMTNQGERDPDERSDSSNDDMRGSVKKAMYPDFDQNDTLLLGPAQGELDLAATHPNPLQIFRLWQIYLEDVDPIFKVTHSSTLQSRIVRAASNLEQRSLAPLTTH